MYYVKKNLCPYKKIVFFFLILKVYTSAMSLLLSKEIIQS